MHDHAAHPKDKHMSAMPHCELRSCFVLLQQSIQGNDFALMQMY